MVWHAADDPSVRGQAERCSKGEQDHITSRDAGSVQCSSNTASMGDSIPCTVSVAGPAKPRG